MQVETLAGARVRLRSIGRDDQKAIDVWYGEAASMAYESRSREGLISAAGDGAADLLVIGRPDGEDLIGLLEYRRDSGWLAISFIALAKAYRGWGHGSEAIRLLEEWATREGIAKRFRADVDARNGLGLYFWLRLGYRPASANEIDSPADSRQDKMPMVRLAG